MNRKLKIALVLGVFFTIIITAIGFAAYFLNNRSDSNEITTNYPLFDNSTLESEHEDNKSNLYGDKIKISTYYAPSKPLIKEPISAYENLLKEKGWEIITPVMIERSCITTRGKAQNAEFFLEYTIKNFCEESASYPGFTYTLSIYPREEKSN